MADRKPILAVCGKGGVGKTAVTALLARVLIEEGAGPLLLIDADPAGGLLGAIGEHATRTLAGVRDGLIQAARAAGEGEKTRLADRLDYLLLEALLERRGYSLLSMGHPSEKGCFCPVNTLLREAIDLVSSPFAAVLIDAEAGLEQIQRQVTRRVTEVVAVTDGSKRGIEVLRLVASLTGTERVRAVVNRAPAGGTNGCVPDGIALVGSIPEDEEVREFDRRGRPLWELPSTNAALEAVRGIARGLRLVRGPPGDLG